MKPFITAAILSACLGASALLGGCAGFQPMHATAATTAAFNDLSVEMGDGSDEADRQAGFLIRQRLDDRINLQTDATYQLVVSPEIRRVGLGLTGQDRASRFDSIVRANWQLLSASDGRVISRGRVDSTASYSASRDPYQLLSTTDEANERAARDVADQLIEAVSDALAKRAETS